MTASTPERLTVTATLWEQIGFVGVTSANCTSCCALAIFYAICNRSAHRSRFPCTISLHCGHCSDIPASARPTVPVCSADWLSVILDSKKYSRISDGIWESHILSVTIQDYRVITEWLLQVAVSFYACVIFRINRIYNFYCNKMGCLKTNETTSKMNVYQVIT